MTKSQYLLICLIEEAAEVVQASCKALRFGLDEIYRPIAKTNRERIVDELTDLHATMEVCQSIDVLPPRFPLCDSGAVFQKKMRIREWADYSRKLGIFND